MISASVLYIDHFPWWTLKGSYTPYIPLYILSTIMPHKHHQNVLLLKYLLSFICIIFILPAFTVFLLYKLHITQPMVAPETSDAVMILGAGILKNGKPGPILAERINEGISLYNNRSVRKILVTGNSLNPKVYDETSAMRLALIKANIPKEDIIIDPLGIDTYSSIYRAKNTYHINSMVITTQSFHLPRSLFIAQALGITAYGIEVDKNAPQLKTYLRELFAIPKAVINILAHRKS